MATPATPVRAAERYDSIDLLRGVALLGILMMNIQMFAMPQAAYFNPTARGDRGMVDFAIWTASHLFFDQKFMTIFSMLFGAGIVVMTSRAAERGARTAVLHYRRMLALLAFGMIHAYLIWDGDILVLYAVCGAIVYPLRRLRPATLFALGLLSLIIGSSVMIAAGMFLPSGPPAVAAEFRAFWAPSPERLLAETAAFQGGWLTQMSMRATHALDFQTSVMWTWGIWRAGGNMLIGMALFKWGVVTGERSQSLYQRMAVIGFGIGLPIIARGVARMDQADWDAFQSFFFAGQFNYWASLLVASGWIGLTLSLWQWKTAPGLQARLIAVGRTAFTCYILTSLLCTFIFYGHGLGLFGRVSRPGQVAVTVGVWIVLLIAAPWWLERFRFGPLEWLWRTLTYATRQPLRRDRQSSRDWPQMSTTDS
jgi:uncharacterized protein